MNDIFLDYRNNVFIWITLSIIGAILITLDVPLFIIESIVFFLIQFLIFTIFKKIIINSNNFIVVIFLLALCIRVFFVFFIAEYLKFKINMPFLSYNDDYNYEMISSALKRKWDSEGIGFYDSISFSKGFYAGYPNFSAMVKYLFGDTLYAPRVMNAVFSSLTVVIFHNSISLFIEEKLARIYSYIFCISSLFVFFAAFQLKDTILVFFVSLIVLSIGQILMNRVNYKVLIALFLSSVFLMFFRAATLFPIYISLLFVYFFVNNKIIKFGARIKLFISLSFLVAAFFISWRFLYKFDILPYDMFSYYDNRMNYEGKDESMIGSNSISKLGVLALFLGPIYFLLSLFLPTPVFVDIFSTSRMINYSFIPLIDYYAILPLAISGFFIVFKKFRKNSFLVFIVLFIILYKLGQAGSTSIFDARQSLPVLYCMYMLVAVRSLDFNYFTAFYKRYKFVIYATLIIVMIVFSFIRIYLRS